MRSIRSLVLVATLLIFAAPAAAQKGSAADRSVRDGVYTKAQATRGKATFANVCGNCHSTGQFRGGDFQLQWEGRSINALFEQLRSTMPIDNPGALTPREYTAVIAYVLELNGYPAGTADLPTAAEAQKRIRIDIAGDTR